MNVTSENGVITIYHDGDNAINLSLDGAWLVITNGSDTERVDTDSQTFTVLNINGSSGDDTLTLDFTNGTPVGPWTAHPDLASHFDGGGGTDVINVMIYGQLVLTIDKDTPLQEFGSLTWSNLGP